MIITQDMINSSLLPIRVLHLKIDLLNSNYATINSLTGISTDGSLNQVINSANRRNGSLSMIADQSLFPTKMGNIWFGNMIKLWIGLDYQNSIQWMNQGIYLVKDCDFKYSSDGSSLASFTLLDLMSNLNGDLSGNLTNQTQILAQSTDLTTAIITTLTSNLIGRLNIDTVKVNGSSALVPYNLIQMPNSTIYALVKQLNDIYMYYEFYFDENGYFILHKIPDMQGDPIAFDFTNINISSSYDNKMDFSLVKNAIYIWGRVDNSGTQIQWVYRNTFSVTSYADMTAIVTKVNGDICYVTADNLSYMWNGSTWSVLDFNVNPKYNITNIGERKLVISDTNIYINDQARLRAQYELWLNNNFGQTVTITCVPLYFLSVNTKVHMNLPSRNIVGDYRITKISTPLKIDQEMSIEMVQIFY